MHISEAFEILGLPETATPGQIKEAYRDLSKVWHPDRFGSDPRLRARAEDTLKRINEAYQFLQECNSWSGPAPINTSASSTTDSTVPPPDVPTSRPQVRYWVYAAAIAFASIPLLVYSFARPEPVVQPTDAFPAGPEPPSKRAGSKTAPPAAAAGLTGADRSGPAARGSVPVEAPQVAREPKGLTVIVPEVPPDTPNQQSQPAPQVAVLTPDNPPPESLTRSPASATVPAKYSRQAFVKGWEGQAVLVRATLYSLLFNERGKLGNTRRGLREGLIVVTPSQGTYFQFNGRQGRDDVVERDPGRVMAAVNSAYQADSLDVRSYRKVEPLAVNRYDPGVELVVSDVRVEGDQVRLDFATPGARDDSVTSIRVRWPIPLSKSLTERDLVEDLLRRFVEIQRP